MPRKKTDTQKFLAKIESLKSTDGKRKLLGDPETEGLFLRQSPGGAKAFYVVAKGPAKDGTIKQQWRKLAPYEDQPNGITLAEARELAPAEIESIRAGAASGWARARPVATPGELTLEQLAEKFLKRQVNGKRRRGYETEYLLERYILPFLGQHEVATLGRTVINAHLDKIEDRELIIGGKKFGGTVITDRVLSVLSTMLKWHESQVDGYQSPITRGMSRVNTKDIARSRILSDVEIRALWTATEQGGTYNNLVRFLMLSAQRLQKCAEAKWGDIDSDGIWVIRPDTELATREKGTAGTLPLSAAVLQVVNSQPQIRGNEHIFAGQGSGHFQGYSYSKKNLDRRLMESLGAEMEPWRIHDLRRTARSLMARAGVQPHIAELTLGHVQKGIIQVYDRYTYEPEKRQALEALADLVESIVGAANGKHEAAG
jgi:integrase